MTSNAARKLYDNLSEFEIRAQRVSMEGTTLKITAVVNGGEGITINNISESGVAFMTETQLDTISDKLNLVLYLNNSEQVYSGQAQIVWKKLDQGLHRYGLAFLNGHLPDGLLTAVEEVSLIAEDLKKERNASDELPKEFMLFVSELRSFLEPVKARIDELETKIGIVSDERRRSYEKAVEMVIGPEVVPALLDYGSKLNTIAASFASKEIYNLAKEVFRRELHKYYKEASFVQRAWQKPLGYAGDFEMMNQIYRDQYEGKSLFGRLMHKWGINEPSSRAVRDRRGYLQNKIKGHLKKNPNAVIGSLACGPAKEIFDLLRDNEFDGTGEFTVVLIDQDREALLNAKRNLVDIQFKRQINCRVLYLQISVKDILEGTELQQKVSELGFDLLYTAGLFDYLTQPVAKMLSSELFSWLKPEGELIVGNFHPRNPSHTIGDFAGEWRLIQRTEQDMRDLLPDDATVEKNIRQDPLEINLFLEAIKRK